MVQAYLGFKGEQQSEEPISDGEAAGAAAPAEPDAAAVNRFISMFQAAGGVVAGG